MGALALHKQEARGQDGQLHSVHDARRLTAQRQASNEPATSGARDAPRYGDAVIRRLTRIVAIVAAVVVVVALVVRALVSRLRPSPDPVQTWPPLAGTDAPSTADPSPPTTVDAPAEPTPDPTAAAEPAAWVEPDGDACPASHPLKAKLASGIFHAPGGLNYERTKPDRCYADAAAAEADGLRPSKR